MKKGKTFTTVFTHKIAELSKLKLNDKETDYLTKQFNCTIETISNINKVKTKGVQEAYNVTGLVNVFREDKIDKKRILSQEEALSNTKRSWKGFFVVKGIFDEK